MPEDIQPPTKARAQLAAELSRLTRISGVTAVGLAKELGIGRATVHRVHAGQSVPSLPVIRKWLDLTDADGDTQRRVLDVAETVHRETVPWSELIGVRNNSIQDDIAEQERQSKQIRTFEPTVIPGLLQSPEYTRRLMPITSTGTADPELAVAARLRRQALLREPGRVFQFMVTESVMRTVPAGLAEEQARWMLDLAQLSTVDLRVVPRDAWVATPWHNFAIHDNTDGGRYVAVELIHGPADLHVEDDITWYLRLWDRLWLAAAHGDDAVELIRSLAAK